MPQGALSGTASLNLDLYPHPRMDAALKVVCALGQIGHAKCACLKNAGLGNRYICKAAAAFGNDSFARRVEAGNKPPAEMSHFCEGVRLPSLINDTQLGTLVYLENVRLEIPSRVRLRLPLWQTNLRGAWRRQAQRCGRSQAPTAH